MHFNGLKIFYKISYLNMRALKEDELKKVEMKVKSFVGDNIEKVFEDKLLKYNNQKVYLASEQLFKQASQFSRDELQSVGTILGRFTKTGNFRIKITGLRVIEKYALNKVWLNKTAEMNFLYGHNAIKAHIYKMSESIPMNAGVIVYNQDSLLLGFGITAVSPTSFQRARSGDKIILTQADNGEYIRNESNLT
ncbi:NIP7 [Hepatospora eriocheir]|uniref:60S ribosome subunit biogenesis protein NIP7 n=1 Tax=Hepatospora eriocheir TaxID=1081669 RepID=A0A1X0QIZ7_9MICR|nr:NIP7 [Hepatospora eriocheir]